MQNDSCWVRVLGGCGWFKTTCYARMQCNPKMLEVGVSHCVEKAEFHFGKGGRKTLACWKSDLRILQLFLWLVNIFFLSPTSPALLFPPLYLSIITTFRQQHIGKQISCNAFSEDRSASTYNVCYSCNITCIWKILGFSRNTKALTLSYFALMLCSQFLM